MFIVVFMLGFYCVVCWGFVFFVFAFAVASVNPLELQ